MKEKTTLAARKDEKLDLLHSKCISGPHPLLEKVVCLLNAQSRSLTFVTGEKATFEGGYLEIGWKLKPGQKAKMSPVIVVFFDNHDNASLNCLDLALSIGNALGKSNIEYEILDPMFFHYSEKVERRLRAQEAVKAAKEAQPFSR